MCVSCLVVKWLLLHRGWGGDQPDTSLRSLNSRRRNNTQLLWLWLWLWLAVAVACRSWLAVAGWLAHLWVCGWQLCEPVILIDAYGTMPCLLMGRDLLGQVWWSGVSRDAAR